METFDVRREEVTKAPAPERRGVLRARGGNAHSFRPVGKLKRAPPGLGRRGSALLAVLWLSAALAAIGFSLATTVHGETERMSTALDGLRSYYLAAAGIDRAAVELLWSVQNPSGRKIPQGATEVTYHFTSGDVHVEFIPETAKLNVNTATLEDLTRLGVALGLDEARADALARAIDQARGTGAPSQRAPAPGPSFRPQDASLQEIEELLSVPGVTPELFYGTYTPQQGAAGGMHLARHPGLVDCLSVYGTGAQADVNTASPAVLAALGMSPAAIAGVMGRRGSGPILADQLGAVTEAAGGGGRLRVGGNSIITMRATARLRLDDGRFSDLRRTVAAMVKYMPPGYDAPIHILRWYDMAWSE